MFNDFMTDNEMLLLAQYGLKGQHFDINSDGFVVQKPEWTSPEKLTELGVKRYCGYTFYTADNLKLAYTREMYRAWSTVVKYPVIPLHAVATMYNTPSDIEFRAAIETMQDEYFWKVATGEWDINSTWDSYVSRWNAAGGQKVIDAKKTFAREMGK
jgi:hypothetical protein